MEESRQELLKELSRTDVQLSPKTEKMIAVNLPKAWKVSEKGMKALRQTVSSNEAKHGMYSSIPMLCRGEACPYAQVCPLIETGDAPDGERCSLEIALILKKFEDYSEEFGIDETNVVDMGLTKDLIDLDIQQFRAENRLAIEGDFIQDVVVAVNERGDEITNPQISKASEYKEKVMTKRHKILELMNSTRKDKAGDKLSVQLDPSTYASRLMEAMASGKMTSPVLDVPYSEED
ncbi:hypothetical protein_gp121 [Bacillus phage vB_BceM_WH1]|nr:hypothetical protein_gp121 [Bacillus phage vB_BceM_WH1]